MNEKFRILFIDDEKSVRDVLQIQLRSQNYVTEAAASASEGIQKIREFHPNLVLLDLGLPDRSGLEVLRELRTWTKVPVIVLTVTDDEEMKVRLLDSGADDYLTKPFGSSELLARIRVGLRHHERLEATPVFESQDLRVDLSTRSVFVDGQLIKLTKTEFEVLQRLVREAGQVVSQHKLLKEIWGAVAQDESHYLRIYIKQLRKKLEKNPADPRHILTEAGVGYRLV